MADGVYRQCDKMQTSRAENASNDSRIRFLTMNAIYSTVFGKCLYAVQLIWFVHKWTDAYAW